MKCSEVREFLARSPVLPPAAQQHGDRCPSCSAAIAAWRRVREGLVAHHGAVEPDAGFRARVVQRLPSSGPQSVADLLGWAALRLLPWAATLVLATLLWWAARPPAMSSDLVLATSSEEALAGLLITGSGGAP